MGTSAKAGRFAVPQNDTRNRAGLFFEYLSLSIIGGMINRENQEFGDIVNDRLSLGVEVKAGDSNNGHGIRVSQKRMYEEAQQKGFPYSHYAYMLCCYRNDDRKECFTNRRPRPLSTFTDKREKYGFLAKDVNKMFLIDLAVMNALENKVGITPCRHPERGDEEDIRLRRRDLEPFCNGMGRDYLKTLGLDPKGWRIGKYYQGFEVKMPDSETGETLTFFSAFPFYTVLPVNLHRKFIKVRELVPAPREPSK